MVSPKTVLITGANQGLGFLTAQLLCKSKKSTYHIIIASRSLSKVQDAIKTLTSKHGCDPSTLSSIEMDVTSPSSISAAYFEVSKTHPRIDILINNAGISDRSPSVHDQFAKNMATNVTGAATVTDTFLPLLRKSADPRLLYVSSGLGSFSLNADPNFPFYFLESTAYKCTKAAMDMLALEQSKFLGKEGIKVWPIDPGYRATNLGGSAEASKGMGATDPMLGAQVIFETAEGERDHQVGKLVTENGEVWGW